MCNCKTLPSVVGPVCDAERDANYAGISSFSLYFDAPDIERFTPAPTSNQYASHTCVDCGQPWYLETQPEEDVMANFALKTVSADNPTAAEIASKKSFLLILAHNGFSAEKCKQLNCPNYALNGRALCHEHWGFPYHW